MSKYLEFKILDQAGVLFTFVALIIGISILIAVSGLAIDGLIDDIITETFNDTISSRFLYVFIILIIIFGLAYWIISMIPKILKKAEI